MMAGMDHNLPTVEHHDSLTIMLGDPAGETYVDATCSHGDTLRFPSGWVIEVLRVTCPDGQDIIAPDWETGAYLIGPVTIDARPQR